MKTDPMEVMRVWWQAADMIPPFTPGVIRGNNDGKVRDARGHEITGEMSEARADVVAAALNYAATRQDAQVRLLCASLLVELGYAPDPRFELKGVDSVNAIRDTLARGPKPFTGVPRMLTLKEADAMIWNYMHAQNWDTLVAESLNASDE